MKFSHFLGIGLLAALALSSCSKGGKTEFDKFDYIPVKEVGEEKWSLLGPDGELIFKGEFKECPSVVMEGVFSVPEEKGITLYTTGSKQPKEIKGATGLKDAGVMVDGLIPVTFPGERISVIDKKGEKKFTLDPIKGKEVTSSYGYFINDVLPVRVDDKWGAVDKNGKVTFEPKYYGIMDAGDGNFFVSTDSAYQNIKIIDPKGNKKGSLKNGYSPATQIVDGRFIAKHDDDFYVMKSDGEKESKLSSKIGDVYDFDGKYIVFSNSDYEYGVMDIKGEILVRAKYEYMELMDGDRFLARGKDECYILDRKGDNKVTLDYKRASYLGKFGLFAGDDDSFVAIDDKGKERKGLEFEDLELPVNGIVDSDYFDIEGLSSTIADLITDQGVDKYTIGASPSNYFSNPDGYTYTSTQELTDLNVETKDYTIKFQSNWSASMAQYEYDYYSYDSYSTWNPASTLSVISMEVKTSRELSSKEIGIIAKAIENKGFKQQKSTSDNGNGVGFWLTKGNLSVLIGREKGSDTLYVLVSENSSDMNSQVKSIFDSLEEGNNSYAAPEITTEETVVESAAVAEAEPDYYYDEPVK